MTANQENTRMNGVKKTHWQLIAKKISGAITRKNIVLWEVSVDSEDGNELMLTFSIWRNNEKALRVNLPGQRLLELCVPSTRRDDKKFISRIRKQNILSAYESLTASMTGLRLPAISSLSDLEGNDLPNLLATSVLLAVSVELSLGTFSLVHARSSRSRSEDADGNISFIVQNGSADCGWYGEQTLKLIPSPIIARYMTSIKSVDLIAQWWK